MKSLLSNTQSISSPSLQQPTSLENILNSVIDVICTIDLEGYFQFVSASSIELWGYQPEEMVGASFTKFILPEDIEKTVQVVATRVDGCFTSHFENRYFKKDGSIVSIIWSGRWSETDRLLYCVARDGSDKKNIEARLEKAQRMARVASFEYDFATDSFTHASDMFYEICGLKKTHNITFSSKLFTDLFHESDKGEITNSFYHPAEKDVIQHEYSLDRADGTQVYIHHQREIIRDETRKPLMSIDTIQDITERKISELALHQREQRFKSLVQNGSDLIGILDIEGNYIYVADSVKPVLGFEVKDLVGKNAFSFIHPDDQEEIHEQLLKIQTSKSLTFEPFRFKNSKEEWRWVETNIINFIDDPAIGGLVTNSRDVTERKKTETELAMSEQKFKSLVQNSSDIIVIIDETGTFKYVSENVLTILGFEPEFFINKNAFDYIHPEDAGGVIVELNKVIHDPLEAVGVSHRFLMSNGEWLWLESKGINHLNNPAIGGIVINSRNVTDRIRLQKQLDEEQLNKQREITSAVIKAQELERSQLGLELHDNVNQVLTTVKLYNEMVLNGYREDKELLIKSTSYLQECINEIRSISKRLSAPTLGNISLTDSIKELVDSINLTNRLAIHYVTYRMNEITISQDLHLAIYRIVQEALNNILKYAEAKTADIAIHYANQKLCVSISDDGKGFDPFIKSKGIGLTNMKTRADNFKGSFKIKTAIGKGCAIEVCFPFSPNPY